MKHLARALLRLATIGIPVVIAACYGMPYRFNRQGKVVDRDTHQGISGIRVSCIGTDGAAESTDYSLADGSVQISWMDEAHPCASIQAEDVDGADNGTYSTTTMPVDSGTATLSILMSKK